MILNSAHRHPSASILVIDDDDSIRAVVQLCLKNAGYSVQEACGRPDVLNLLRKGRFDLVITDVLMPEIDGAEVISATMVHQPGAAILAMSGGGPYLPAGLCLKIATALGAGAPLAKPFHLVELLSAVESALQRCPPAEATC